MTPSLRKLCADFPADFVTDAPDDLALYGRDATRVYESNALAVVKPRSTAEVARFLAACNREGIPVVPSGGRTGLAGGAVACRGEVVLSLERMRMLHPVDTLGMTVRAEAGATTQSIHAHAAEHDLTWPVDLAAKGSSTVGGNIATNAGGVRVIRFGVTRHWVLGLEVVLADGTILDLNGALEKNNTGIDLKQLFIGSEGILGVVTEATLKLTRAVDAGAPVFLFAVDSLASVLTLFSAARRGPFILNAFEFFTSACLARVVRHRALVMPIETTTSHYVVMEVEAAAPGGLDAWLEEVTGNGTVKDGTLAADLAQARHIWDLREGISESLSATGLPHKNDIAVPIAALAAFSAELEELLARRYPAWELCLFGHIGDGNVHVNAMKPEAMSRDEFFAATHLVDADVFALVAKYDGSISAEHGIGLLKRSYLGFSRAPEEIALMRSVKAAFDPKGILNPGKVL